MGGVIINELAIIGRGSRISVNKNAEIHLGKNFVANGNATIICRKRILFGEDCLLSWDVQVMDSDWHKITSTNGSGKVLNEDREIIFGNHVWIGCKCNILKGSIIPTGSIIASGSIISAKLSQGYAIYGGQGDNVRIIREDITWG